MKTFDHILLLGRPAAGKSEIIDALKKMTDAERAERFHIGKFEQIDDFLWIWEKFLEDDLWEESGFDRLYSHKEGNNYGLNEDQGKLFDFMMVKLNDAVDKQYLSNQDYYNDGTLFIEFSRGGEFNYGHSLPMLSDDILKRAAILYVDVSFDESMRRNNARYEEKKQHSILAHKATDRVMNAFYQNNDWAELTSGNDEGYIEVRGIEVPFVNVKNEPEIKEPGPLTARYETRAKKLFELYSEK